MRMKTYPMIAKNIKRTLYKRYGITVITTKTSPGWKATANLKPNLRNGVRSLTILGVFSATRASREVREWAEKYIDEHG